MLFISTLTQVFWYRSERGDHVEYSNQRQLKIFYKLLLEMIEQIAKVRENWRHADGASQPDGARAPFYKTPYAKTYDQYCLYARNALSNAYAYYAQADIIFAQNRNGESMRIDIKRFSELLTYSGNEKGNYGKSALNWFRAQLKRLQSQPTECLSPIEIRRQMYRRQDPIQWHVCEIPPEPEQLENQALDADSS